MSGSSPTIDAHGHLGLTPRFHVPWGGTADVLDMLDALDVSIAVCAHQTEIAGDREQAHREIMEAYERGGGRLLAYAVFNPWQDGCAKWVQQRLAAGRPYVGIKIHPTFHECGADDEAYRPAWELALRHRVPLLSHTWDCVPDNPAQALSFPELFASWLERFPEVMLIMGHGGGRPAGHIAAAKTARRFANVHVDLAGDSYTWGIVEWFVAQMGAERVLFGSDFNWMDPRTHLGRVLAADIPEQARGLILGGNAARLFRLVHIAPHREG